MAKRTPRKRAGKKKSDPVMIFSASNYKIMSLGALLIFLGFLIMALENQIEGFLSLYISPWLIVAGFIIFGYGIIKKTEPAQPAETPTKPL